MYASVEAVLVYTYIGQMFEKCMLSIKPAINALLDNVLPASCIVTGEAVETPDMVSAQVWEQLEFITEPYCSICGAPFSFESEVSGALCVSCIRYRPAYDIARSALLYGDMSRKLILKFKSADQMQASHIFTPWLVSAGAEFIREADYIIPVPLHKSRLIKRRYNQAAILAQNISSSVKVPALLDGLSRIRATAIQGSDAAKSRKKNVSGAFEVPKKHQAALKGKNIIVIDDVYASGSTIQECTKVLKRAGAGKVYVLTIARSILPQ